MYCRKHGGFLVSEVQHLAQKKNPHVLPLIPPAHQYNIHCGVYESLHREKFISILCPLSSKVFQF